ncbi:MAG: 2'-5' RNA ligase family protein [bacterium]|nr:2'-5' RNA ligase family protein [bacterium]
MQQDQIKRYEDLRKRILGDQGQIKFTSKEKRMAEPSHVSLNFSIDTALWPGIMDVVGRLEKEDPGHEYIYPSAFHCTLKLCSGNNLPETIEKISKALENFKPFEVVLQGLNSFTTNAFIQVFSEDGNLFDLHDLLNDVISSGEPEFEGENYIPHVAAIYYYHKPDKLFSVLGEYKDILIGKMKIDKINLIKGNTALFVHRIETIKTFQLK